MYYCLCCGAAHERTGTAEELVFKTGYHFVGRSRMAVGLCEGEKRSASVPEKLHRLPIVAQTYKIPS